MTLNHTSPALVPVFGVLFAVSALYACTPSPKATLSVVQAPMTDKDDWQMVKSDVTDARYTSAAGDIRIIHTQNNQDAGAFQGWITAYLAHHALAVTERSSVEPCAFATHCMGQYMTLEQDGSDAKLRQRLEFYQVNNRLVIANISSNIDAKSYGQMQSFLKEKLAN